jgi:hypothetical protein
MFVEFLSKHAPHGVKNIHDLMTIPVTFESAQVAYTCRKDRSFGFFLLQFLK